jgi:hypothetical protein
MKRIDSLAHAGSVATRGMSAADVMGGAECDECDELSTCTTRLEVIQNDTVGTIELLVSQDSLIHTCPVRRRAIRAVCRTCTSMDAVLQPERIAAEFREAHAVLSKKTVHGKPVWRKVKPVTLQQLLRVYGIDAVVTRPTRVVELETLALAVTRGTVSREDALLHVCLTIRGGGTRNGGDTAASRARHESDATRHTGGRVLDTRDTVARGGTVSRFVARYLTDLASRGNHVQRVGAFASQRSEPIQMWHVTPADPESRAAGCFQVILVSRGAAVVLPHVPQFVRVATDPLDAGATGSGRYTLPTLDAGDTELRESHGGALAFAERIVSTWTPRRRWSPENRAASLMENIEALARVCHV